MTVDVSKDGPVTTIGINRPDVRNAVDRATAEALVAAFEEFDADPDAAVAVLHGRRGLASRTRWPSSTPMASSR